MMDTSQEKGREVLRLIKSSRTSEFTRGDAALAWKWLEEKYSRANGPRRAKLTREHQETMLKLFSEENEDYQVRDKRQMKQNAELNNCDLK